MARQGVRYCCPGPTRSTAALAQTAKVKNAQMRCRTLTEPLRRRVPRLNKPACCSLLFWRTTITVIDPAYTRISALPSCSASIVHPPAFVGAFSSRATPAHLQPPCLPTIGGGYRRVSHPCGIQAAHPEAAGRDVGAVAGWAGDRAARCGSRTGEEPRGHRR